LYDPNCNMSSFHSVSAQYYRQGRHASKHVMLQKCFHPSLTL